MWLIAMNRLTALLKTQNWSIWPVHYINHLRPKLMCEYCAQDIWNTFIFLSFLKLEISYYYYLIKISNFAQSMHHFWGVNYAFKHLSLKPHVWHCNLFSLLNCSTPGGFNSAHVLLRVESGLNIVWNRSWHSFPVQLQCVESLISRVLSKSIVLKLLSLFLPVFRSV